MIVTTCRVMLIAYLVLSFFYGTWGDFNGRDAKQPGGFRGFIGTLVVIAILAATLYGAGAFGGIDAIQP